MSLLLKDPDAILDYSVDWAAEYLDGDQVVVSQWAVSPAESGAVEIIGSSFEPGVTAVKVGGGLGGRLYRLTNMVTLSSGREDSRSIILRVERR